MDILLLCLVTLGGGFGLTQIFSRMDNIDVYTYKRYYIGENMEELAQEDFAHAEEGVELRKITEDSIDDIVLSYMSQDNWEIAYERYAEASKNLSKDYRNILKTREISMIDDERDATRLAVEEIEKAGEKWQ